MSKPTGVRLKAKKKAAGQTRKKRESTSAARSRARDRSPDRKRAAANSGIVPTVQKLTRLVETMGNNWVAAMLEVSPSQPSRWRTGEEGISAENARRVTDLEYVMSRLLQLYTPHAAKVWLESYNALLEGRPVDVLHLRGALAVGQAVDADAQGAYS